jgi:hypothetical protein
MNYRENQIGFSQRIRLEWLEQTVNLVLAGNDKARINEALQELLEDKVSIGGEAERGNREKIITILMKVWLNVPRELEAFRIDGIGLLKRVSRPDRIVIHWGMVMAVYPFWSAVAAHVGRLLKIQGSAAAMHVQRRIREQYGERETVSRATRRVLRSYLDWGVLGDTSTKGVYSKRLSLTVDEPKIISWLIEASLYAGSNGAAPLNELIGSPSLFPFHLKPIGTENVLAASSRLEILRHGLDDDLVMLRKHKSTSSKEG